MGKQGKQEVWEVWEDGEALIFFPHTPHTPHTPSSPSSPSSPHAPRPIPKTVFWATNCTPNVILVLQRLNLYLSVNKHYGFCKPIDRRDSSRLQHDCRKIVFSGEPTLNCRQTPKEPFGVRGCKGNYFPNIV
ncbi:MAG: hypothetical protein RMY29_029975 [Nostoc sp. CreGUA01]|nr:hypothetical protein [Nostoc sp. CreGUA01]